MNNNSYSINQYFFVGTYTNSGSKGIYVMCFDGNEAAITEVSTQGVINNPSYLSIFGNHVYAVSETGGNDPGSGSAFHFNPKTGMLQFLNNQLTGGDGPCFVDTDKSGRFAVVANYSGGSVSLFKTNDGGALISDKQFIQHTGGSVNPIRQKRPHVHQSIFSPDQKYLLTPDLGKDKVMIYRFNMNAEEPLSLYKEIGSDPGTGPRHITFHPRLSFAYLIHEMIPMVSIYSYTKGDFKKIQEIPTWPSGFTGKKDGAEIKVSPDGRFLYISHRGDQNTIGIYAINQKDGKITLMGNQEVYGKGPRDFEIEPSGRFLLVANQQSNNIVTFRIDKETGLLNQVGSFEIPKPVCIKFYTN